jgi:hypothetical protein
MAGRDGKTPIGARWDQALDAVRSVGWRARGQSRAHGELENGGRSRTN